MNNCITADEKNIESCEKIVDYFKKIAEYKKNWSCRYFGSSCFGCSSNCNW